MTRSVTRPPARARGWSFANLPQARPLGNKEPKRLSHTTPKTSQSAGECRLRRSPASRHRARCINSVTDVTAIKDVRNVWQWHHHKTARVRPQSGLNALLDGEERQRVLGIGPVLVAHRDASLPDPSQPLLDQEVVAIVERLIAADEKRRRLLRGEGRTHAGEDLFRLVPWRSLLRHPHIEGLGRNEHAIGIRKAPLGNAIDPDDVDCLRDVVYAA